MGIVVRHDPDGRGVVDHQPRRILARAGDDAGRWDTSCRALDLGNYDLEASFDGAVRWSCFSVWKQHYGWSRADGALLIVYRPATAFSQRVQAVDVLAGGELTIPRVLLIALGGYLLQRTHEDMAASAAALSA